MDIVLDSNIFRSDFLLRSKDFEVLMDYLTKTNSSIIMPQVILDEIKELYSRSLKDRLTLHNKSISNINLMLTSESNFLNAKELNVEFEATAYVAFLRKRLAIRDAQILPYNDSFLKEVAHRAIKRLKPSGEEGQGFRDTLIWLTIKEYCKKCHGKQITFISFNDKDFANAEKTDLHESLASECETLNIKINYFKTIREFIEKHSVKIELFTEHWVEDNIDLKSVKDLIIEEINRSKPRSIQSWLGRRRYVESSEYFSATHVDIYECKEFFVYELLGNRYIITVKVIGEVELEHEYYANEYFRSTDDSYSKRIQIGHEHLDFEAHVSLSYENGEILDIELSELNI
jgi:hypothetical protein